jgi:hypothetical protein
MQIKCQSIGLFVFLLEVGLNGLLIAIDFSLSVGGRFSNNNAECYRKLDHQGKMPQLERKPTEEQEFFSDYL